MDDDSTPGYVCDALGVEPDDLADVCKREAARLLRLYAQRLDTALPVDPDDDVLERSRHWLMLAGTLEDCADRVHRSGADQSERGTEATPLTHSAVGAASQKGT
jgi:hypothetical protein